MKLKKYPGAIFIARRCSQDIAEHNSTAAARARHQHSGSSTAAAAPPPR